MAESNSSNDLSPTESGASPEKARLRRRRRRRRWLVLAVVAVVAGGFYCYVMFRGPSDYLGELAQLLPARTSTFIALNDFDGVRKHLADTRLYAQLSRSVDLAALLMTNEDWREFQEHKDSMKWKAKAALAREFLRRYFSRQFVVALATLDACDEAALLVLAQTDLGFAERLAELCAELYPELQLVTERYRDVPLHFYEGEESKRSFGFVRFGKTVVLSLRSNERDYLRRIIDYRLDAPDETLFETADFQAAWRMPARRRGLLALGRPDALLDDLLSRPDFKVRGSLDDTKQARLRRALGWIDHVRVGMTAEEGIATRLIVRRDEESSPPLWIAPPDAPLALLDVVPADCLGFAVLRFGNLAETLARILNVHRAFTEKADDPGALGEAVQRLNALWGIDVNAALAPALGHEAAVVIHNVQLPMLLVTSILCPVADPDAARTAMDRFLRIHRDRYADPDNAWQVPDTFRQTPGFQPVHSTPFGFLGAAWLGDYCMWGLNPNAYVATRKRLEGATEPIRSSPVFQALGLPIDRPLDAVAFVNLEEIGARAQVILGALAVVSKSVRERSAKYGKILAIVRLVRGVGLYATHTEDEWTFVLKVPTR